MSKGIFSLENKPCEILYDYIDLCFFEEKKDFFDLCINLMKCFCLCNQKETIISFSPTDMFFRDHITKWVYDLSMSYIRQSGIDFTKLRLYQIECIKSNHPIIIENSKAATVIFQFSKRNNCYITTHKTFNRNLEYHVDDKKYIVVVYESL